MAMTSNDDLSGPVRPTLHRFWIFPLFLGLVGAVYPVLCVVEASFAVPFLVITTRTFDWGQEISNLFWVCWRYGGGAGVLLGFYAAWRDRTRGVAVEQSNEAVATRLLSNVGWLLVYGLLFLGSTALAVWGVMRAGGVSPALLKYWFPGIFFVETGLVNLVAIVWAARRTAHINDILNPLVAVAKLKASNQMTPRTRKPSRHDLH